MQSRSVRVLFTLIPGAGHLSAVAPLARALQDSGHEVRVATAASFGGAVQAVGLTPVATGADWAGTPPTEDFARQSSIEQLRWLTGFTSGPQAAGLVELAGSWTPDLMVRDNLDFGAWAAAEELNLPVAVFGVTDTMPAPVAQLLLGDVLASLRSERGLAPDPELTSLTGDAYLDRTPPALANPYLAADTRRWAIRPEVYARRSDVMAPGWLDDLGGRPLVYVTLGTVVNRLLPVFRTIAEALEGRDIDVVMTTGDPAAVETLRPLPANVRTAAYIPQDAVLAKASGVVCHAGRGTVYGALGAGVPLCLLPLGTDQPLVAAACARAGAAVVCATTTTQIGPMAAPLTVPADLTAQMVSAAVDSMLAGGDLHRRTREIAAEIAAMPAAAEVAERLPELAGARRA
ncbi:MAG TPA: glycosyltransferase [Actinomycetota bacterium]|nr:glycosyltransferase [Actinomycetota bacterium]